MRVTRPYEPGLIAGLVHALDNMNVTILDIWIAGDGDDPLDIRLTLSRDDHEVAAALTSIGWHVVGG